MQKSDDNYLRQIEKVLVEAGQIMEDASLDFARALPDINTATARIIHLERISGDLHALAAAARVFLFRTD